MKHVTAALVLVAILVPAFYLTAQDANSTPGTLQEEMSALNVTMTKIAVLLEKQIEGQETELLIKRVDLTNRTLLANNEELRKAREELADLTEEERPMRINLEGWQERVAQGKVPEENREMLELEIEQMESRWKLMQNRKRELDRSITELENAVMTQEKDMRILEEVLDDKLGLR